MADQDFVWPEGLPEPEFLMLPKVYFSHIRAHLTLPEREVLLSLMYGAYEWGKGTTDRSVRDLMDETGLSRTSVQNALNALQRVQLIAVEHRLDRRGGTDANLYRVRISTSERFTGGQRSVPPSPRNRRTGTTDAPPTRARSSVGKKHTQEAPVSIDPRKYSSGRYAVCAVCGARPCSCP